MNDFFTLGAVLGLVIGLFHSSYLYGIVTAGAAAPGSRITALNFGFWTCALWFLLGGYLLAYTLAAVICYFAFRGARA